MRTTIVLPDDLHAQVRHLAREGGTTVSSVIERSLRAEIQRMQSLATSDSFRIRPFEESPLGWWGLTVNGGAA